MLYCFGSYILADLLLGGAPLDCFSNNGSILLATAVWYLTFFCPLNLFYKCVSFLPVKLVFVAMKEVVRGRKIAAGVHHAHHAYHHGWAVMVIIGFVKGLPQHKTFNKIKQGILHTPNVQYVLPVSAGSGVALMSNFEQLLRGVWKPETNELLHMTFPSKASLYGALLFTLQQTHWLPVSKVTLLFSFTLFMMVCKVFMTATHSHGSPFALVEGPLCSVLFGSAPPAAHEDPHQHHYEPSHHHPQHEPPAKSREELNEGTRKRKAKKAE
ncbi:trimeric intracellular cation channel type A isoform X3 [Anolis carolinensis]